MDEGSLKWLRRLVTRALDVDCDVFDTILTAKPRRASFRGNQAEVCMCAARGFTLALCLMSGLMLSQWQTLNAGAAPGEILKSFFLPDTEAGSILFFYLSHEEYEIEGTFMSLPLSFCRFANVRM